MKNFYQWFVLTKGGVYNFKTRKEARSFAKETREMNIPVLGPDAKNGKAVFSPRFL